MLSQSVRDLCFSYCCHIFLQLQITDTNTLLSFSYLPFGGGPRKCVGDMFASFETVVAVAMLVRRFNFQMALGAPPVEMTTGATIHTTQGLKMTVTRRIKPPIIPELGMQGIKMEASAIISEEETQLGEKGEVSQAHSHGFNKPLVVESDCIIAINLIGNAKGVVNWWDGGSLILDILDLS
ncbi:hypothetical protein REPUB_Repub16aG0052500 [Reevesia pubescens]